MIITAHDRHARIVDVLDDLITLHPQAERPSSHDLATKICDLFQPDDEELQNCTVVSGALVMAFAKGGITSIEVDNTFLNELVVQLPFMGSPYRLIIRQEPPVAF
jgi:hypothetical protein